MRNILIGNGINIEFGGGEFSNCGIINRLMRNIQIKDYSIQFGSVISSRELGGIVDGLRDVLLSVIIGKFDDCCQNFDEKFTLNRIKSQYNAKTELSDIGMEDYFFLLKVFHNKFNDTDQFAKATFDGMCILLMDAIFDDGGIQKIHETIELNKKSNINRFLSDFDNIFTVNYDCNVEKLSGISVNYLHGDFNTLLDQYNPNTLIGRIYQERGEINPVTISNKHMYCNGIMGFTGSLKEKVMKIFEDGQEGINKMIEKIDAGLLPEEGERLEKMRTSSDEREQFAYYLIQTRKGNPSLGMHQYPRKKFMKISDEISIVGLSPNNDEHIWKMINQNPSLQQLVYYYKSEYDKNTIKRMVTNIRVVTKPVNELWDKM